MSGVQVHEVADRIRDFPRVDMYRLVPGAKLSWDQVDLLEKIVTHFIGKEYDKAQVLIAGTKVFKFTRLMPGADLNQVFCSELSAHVAMCLNRFNWDNPTKYNPASFVRKMRRHGTITKHSTHTNVSRLV